MNTSTKLSDLHYIEVINTTQKDESLKKGYFAKEEGSSEYAIAFKWCAEVLTFNSYIAAQSFAQEEPMFKLPNIKYYIKSGEELARSGKESEFKEPLFTVKNQAGWKLFFSEIKKEYYWDNKDTGYVVVHQAWIDCWQPRLEKKYPLMTITYVPIENGKLVTL